MLNERIIEQLVNRLVERIEQANVHVLGKIGESIKKIGTLSSTNAHQLAQVLKYGGSYNEIVNYLAKITELNKKDIYKIFEEVAKKDYQFAKKFYDYRGIDYIPFEQNEALKRQVRAIARITTSRYTNLSNTLGFTQVVNGKRVFTPLYKVYTDTIDKAVLSVSQGKTAFYDEMHRTVKELATSSLKTVDYATSRSVRLDSTVRKNMLDAIRDLHNEIQQQLGEEFGADGVEVSVHQNPADDHAEVQGKQFSNEEFDSFQNDRQAISYDGKIFPPEFEGHDRRSISQHNCYHTIFSIILGVSEPEYSEEQLQNIINKNNEGFMFEGKHYTNYEGTQLQRKIELEIRKNKDMQIMARKSGDEDLILESQKNITILNKKYKELNEASGLPSKHQRMLVSGYRRVKTKKK